MTPFMQTRMDELSGFLAVCLAPFIGNLLTRIMLAFVGSLEWFWTVLHFECSFLSLAACSL